MKKLKCNSCLKDKLNSAFYLRIQYRKSGPILVYSKECKTCHNVKRRKSKALKKKPKIKKERKQVLLVIKDCLFFNCGSKFIGKSDYCCPSHCGLDELTTYYKENGVLKARTEYNKNYARFKNKKNEQNTKKTSRRNPR